MAEFEYLINQGPSIVEMRNSLAPLEDEDRRVVEFWLDKVRIVATGETLVRFCTPLWLFIEKLELNEDGHASGEQWSFRGKVARKCWTHNNSTDVEGYFTPKNNTGHVIFVE
jgi:hypothetical protein